MKSKLTDDHANDARSSRWILVQQEDITPHIEQEAQYADGTGKRRVVPINDFMQENGPPPWALQTLIDRLLEDG